MTRTLLLASALAITSATAMWAQDTTTPPAEPATDQANPALEPQLDMGEAVPNAPQRAADATYVAEKIGDWDIQCLKLPEEAQGEDPCQMYQLLTDGQGTSVAEISLFRLAGGGQVVAGATFVVPLETLLTEKLTLQVDAGQAKRYDFSFCTKIGCYARVGFTAQDIAGFKAGNVAKIGITPALAPDQKVTLEMSLKGFTASFDKVTELRQNAADGN